MNAVELGEICELRNGRAFKPEEWSDSGTPIVRIQNLNDESKPFNYCAFDVPERFRVESGDLLFSWSGTPGTSFGAFFWTRGRGFLNQHIFRVDVDGSRVDQSYLRYALNSLLDQIVGQSHGGVGLKHITKGKLEAVKIPLPPLPEQRRIAAILDKADALRAKRREAIAKCDQLLQSVFLDMFGDPVTNPKGWPVKPLGELGTLDRGKSKHRPRNDPALLGGSHPLIQTGDVANSGGYIRSFASTYSDLGLQQSRKWPVGTLCITIAANIANTGILTFEACFPDSVVGFAPNSSSTTEYVQQLMGFLKIMLEEKAPQVAQKNINLAILRNLPVPMPPIADQKRFSQFVAQMERQKLNQRSQSHRYGDLFSSLQQRAFSGQLIA